MQPYGGDFKGGGGAWQSGSPYGSYAGRSGAGPGRVLGRAGFALDGSSLPLEEREVVEAEVAGGGLGLGGGQGWSAGRQAEAVEDGADGFLGLDGGEQAQAGSTARTHEGVDGEHVLEKLSPGEPSRGRDAYREPFE